MSNYSTAEKEIDFRVQGSEVEGLYLESLEPRQYDHQHVMNAHHQFLEANNTVGFYQIDQMLLVASPGVYHPMPGSSTIFMLENLPAIERCRVLDMGTGCGAIAINVARGNNVVTAVDIDVEAVRCARFNAKINDVEISVFQSDLFSALDPNERFDVVIFNIPFFEKEQTHRYENIACDPGSKILENYMRQLPRRLAAGGISYLAYSNIGNLKQFQYFCRVYGLESRVFARNSDNETNVERYLIRIETRK